MNTPLQPEALADALQSERLPVLLEAPEGQGRSHSLKGLAEVFLSRGKRLLVVSCREGPALAQLVRALTGVTPSEAEPFALALLESPALASLEASQRRQAAELLVCLVGPLGQGFVTASLDAASRREGGFTELIRCLALQADAGLAMVAFDDVHTADTDVFGLLDFLVQLDGLPVRLLLTADADPIFSTPAFRERRDRWLDQKQLMLSKLPAPPLPAVETLLSASGCFADEIPRLAAATKGNPGLALGVWSLHRRNPLASFPRDHDALRVESLRARGPKIWAVAQQAAVLGDRFLERAFGADIDGELLGGAGLSLVAAEGPFGPVLGFRDSRVRRAVLPTVPAQQREIWQRTAGLWAVARLPELVPVFEQGADALLPLAFFALDRPEASFWQEAWAGLLAARGELNAALEVQLAAAANAQGARRAVLLRRIADAQLFAGQPEKTLATLSTIGRASLAASPVPTGPVARVLAAQARPLLDRWESLSSDEALAMVDLTRAEALSHLVKKDDTTKAFGDLEKRLEKLSGDVAAQLWARWARSQAWFLCEILGKAAVALKACQKVRTRVPAELLAKDPDLLGFVRAEEIACSGLGDFTRALQLAEEMTALAGARNDVRGQCLAWNARAILHLGQGEPGPSRKGFERSLELARATGWRRREAITTHNLALVLLELGDWDRAQAYEERYAALSITIGNHAASAEAPAVLAGVALARGDLSKAELLITQTRKAAESNEWGMLLAWSRALAGKLRLQRYAQARDSIELSKARNDLLAAIDLFEESSTSWTEEVDPAEVYALHAAALKLGGNASGARDALARAQKHVPAQNVVSVRALAVGAAFVEGGGIEPALEWFVTRGYQRLTGLWRQLTM